MKKTAFMISLILAVAGILAWGTASAEYADQIVMGSEGPPNGWISNFPEKAPWFQGDWITDNLIPQFESETGIKVDFHPYADQPMQMMADDLQSKTPPDVILAFASRVAALRPYAADLEAYLPSGYLARFNPSFLEAWRYDGKLFALPHVGWTAFYAVDKTLAEQVGAADLLPADDNPDRSWTLNTFKEFLRRVKAANLPDTWGTVLFANGTGGDYWSTYGFLAGFGAKLYDNGRVAIDTPQGRDALEFMRWMVEQGYAPPEVAAYSYRELIDGWQKNRFASSGGNVTWVIGGTGGFKATGVTNGFAKTEHKAVHMEWPHVAGLKNTPIMFGPDAVIVIDNGDPARIRAAVKFATEYLSSDQTHLARMEGVKWSPLAAPPQSPRPGVETPLYRQLTAMIGRSGVWDMGFGITANSALRDLWARLMQLFFNGDLTAGEVTRRFTVEGNAAIMQAEQDAEAAKR